MRPTRILVEDHDLIERFLNLQDDLCGVIARGDPLAPSVPTQLLEFFRCYADGAHHHREERFLFPALERAGLPTAEGPIGVMLAEHDLGRARLSEMAASLPGLLDGSPEERRAYVEAARGYSVSLRSHIQKENGVLFRMADRILDDEEHRRILEELLASERESGANRREEWAKVASALEGTVCASCAR